MAESVSHMEADGKSVPQWVKDMLASGRNSFYSVSDGKLDYYDVISQSVQTKNQSENSINLNVHKTG